MSDKLVFESDKPTVKIVARVRVTEKGTLGNSTKIFLKLQVKDGREDWAIFKRLRDVVELHKELPKEKRPEYPFKRQGLTRMSSRTSLDSDDSNVDNGESMSQLENYFNTALAVPELRSSDLLTTFLDPFHNAVETRLCEAPTAEVFPIEAGANVVPLKKKRSSTKLQGTGSAISVSKRHIRSSDGANHYILNVELLQGKQLTAADLNGKSDPYCVLNLQNVDTKDQYKPYHRSSVQKKTLSPVWNEKFEFEVLDTDHLGLYLEVFDWDRISSDDFIGCATYPLRNKLQPGNRFSVWLPLVGKPGEREDIQGEIEVAFLLEKPE